ncbi:hypothetical protein [Streptomyces chilikensis]|uniref:Lipoprotein n=1 Tax=Streptomyces chilikensis TaxID=1194079 RepID=A0ABV3EKR2_9ACTN
MKFWSKPMSSAPTAVVAVMIGSLLLAACTPSSADRTARRDVHPYWEKGAGAAEAAAFMKVRIPEKAAEVKGAVRVQSQEKLYLLSFVTDERTAEVIAEDLRPDSPLRIMTSGSSLSGDGFEHLGLTPPQELKDVREASACPPCTGDSRRGHVQGIEMHVGEEAGTHARVYLTAY